jgi:hypothetical protein
LGESHFAAAVTSLLTTNRRDPTDLLVIISAREVESRYRCEPGGGFLLFLAGSDGEF